MTTDTAAAIVRDLANSNPTSPRSPQGDANAIVLAALAEAYGATPQQATAIADQVLNEYRSTEMDATSAPAVVGRVRELVEEHT